MKRGILSPVTVAVLTCLVLVVMLPEVWSKRYMVGGNQGWSANVNYTLWARNITFYTEDWLFFVYDRYQMDVLEVNRTNYETCNAEHPMHNYTTGAGRDVVALNVTRNYYFISSKGFCYSGMKLAVHVVKTPPPPKASPEKSDSPSRIFNLRSQIVFPTVLAMAAVWDSLLRI
ncbi:early nodulin-like protein 17 [Apium graveolens]|uniref:early nodulin-like protein 17 n=1 Tax=Apium graveolens TaxID=4045 RepID=UPI003D79648E